MGWWAAVVRSGWRFGRQRRSAARRPWRPPRLRLKDTEGGVALENCGFALETGGGHACGDKEGVFALMKGVFALAIGVLLWCTCGGGCGCVAAGNQRGAVDVPRGEASCNTEWGGGGLWLGSRGRV